MGGRSKNGGVVYSKVILVPWKWLSVKLPPEGATKILKKPVNYLSFCKAINS